MSAFVDASILVAILGEEEDWQECAVRLDGVPDLLWSPVSRWESIIGLHRRRRCSIERAQELVDGLGIDKRLRMVSIGDPEAVIAVEAATRYGRATGHPAQLNMGDCFAYACAKTNHARLLYKGEDFAHTDLG